MMLDGLDPPLGGGTVHRFGLDLDLEAFERLGVALDRITEAEQDAWRSLR